MSGRAFAGTSGLLLVLAASGVGGCNGCGKTDTGKTEQTSSPVAAPPVPAPDDLLADATVLTPNATWRRVQSGIGGAIGLMPQTTGTLMASLAGLDIALGPELDGSAPAYLSLAGEPDDPSWAIAMKVVEERKVRDVLVQAENAKYVGKEENGLTILTSKSPSAAAVGLALDPSGYLIVGKDEAAVRKLGPYTARALPKKPPTTSAAHIDVTAKGLSGKVRIALEKRWQAYAVDLLAEDARMREQRGGRAPDFGDPKAIVALADAFVQRKLSALSSLTKLTVDVDAEAEDIHVRAEAEGPVEDGGLAPMTVGDVAPLLEIPQDTISAIFTRSQGEERAQDAKELEAAVTSALGGGARLPDGEAKKLHSVLDDFAKGRGDALTLVALGGEGRGKGLVLRTESKGEESSRAVSTMADLARGPVFKEPLRIKSAQRTTGEAVGVGKCDVLDLTIEGKGKLPDTKLGLAWTVEGGKLSAALGDAPLDLVARAARPAKKVGDDKVLTSYVTALGKDASFVFFAQPFLVDQSKPVAPSPAVLAWGTLPRAKGARWARLDVSDRVIRELLKKQLGL